MPVKERLACFVAVLRIGADSVPMIKQGRKLALSLIRTLAPARPSRII
jgi:hypothetical protein